MKVPEQFRLKEGYMASDETYGNNGVFVIPFESRTFDCIASDGMGWEHVSVSLSSRTPNWKEMCHIKSLFWDEGECVIQYHPSREDYVNNHEHCLHLWKPIGSEIDKPPKILIGF